MIAGLVLVTQAALADIVSLPVPVRTILPSETLQESDFSTKDFIVNDSIKRNYLLNTKSIDRTVAIRVLTAGKPVALRFIKRKADARKGQAALARFVSGGIEIQGYLVPEQDGAAGEVIKVKNAQTGVSLLAVVSEDGTLVVGEQ